ncbi:MAG: response regulator [Cyanobacteria bacterium P01_A01_bin.83]
MVNLQVKDDSSNSITTEPGDSKPTDISILLVDDQISIRESLHASLEPEPELKVVAKAIDGQTAISQVETFYPDIVLIDIEMPGMSGLEATRIIKQGFPNTKIIILSSYDDDEYINQALKIGVNGYLLKTTPTAEIVDAIRYVHKGYLQLGPGLLEKLNSKETAKLEDETSKQNLDHDDRLVKYESAQTSVSTSTPDAQIDQTPEECHSIVYVPKTSSSLVTTRSLISDSNEWSSLTKELIETLPRVWTRGLLYALMVIVGIILPWAMFSKVDETGSARGKLEPQGKVFTVDAPVSGTVEEVFVSEGQLVKSQQPLLSLESEPVENELEQVQTELEGQRKELAQLKLLKNQLVLTVNTQKQQNTAQLFEKQAQLDQARQDVKHTQTALNLALKANQEAKKEVQRFVEAKNQGIVSEIQVIEKKDAARERERLLEQANAENEQAQLRAVEQQKSYQSLTHSGDIAVLRGQEQLKEIEQQIVTLNSQIKSHQSKINGLSYQLEQRIVKSPVNGSIFQLPAQETGTVLEPGGLVAEIAPQQSSLILKAQMIPTESGSLEQGMPVKMKFDAYPFQDYGVVEGEVVSISPTTKVVDTAEGKAESYELEVKLDRDYIQAKNKRVTLRAGQTATAEVIVRQRRLIDFVLDPFKKLNEDGLEL